MMSPPPEKAWHGGSGAFRYRVGMVPWYLARYEVQIK